MNGTATTPIINPKIKAFMLLSNLRLEIGVYNEPGTLNKIQCPVILSGVDVSRSEASTQSKDP
jgi:hypothetical protein